MTERIVVDPVTRIEGHLRIEVDVAEDGQISDAFSSGTSVRGLEIILQLTVLHQSGRQFHLRNYSVNDAND